MGTLASRAKIGFWVHAPGALLREYGAITPKKISDFMLLILPQP